MQMNSSVFDDSSLGPLISHIDSKNSSKPPGDMSRMNSLQKMTQIDEQAEKILLEDNGGGNEQEEVDSLLDLRAKIVYSQLRD